MRAECSSEVVRLLVDIHSYLYLWTTVVGSKWKNWIQAASVSLFWRVSEHWVRSLVIWEGLRVHPRVLNTKRSPLRHYWYLNRMLPGHLLGEVFQACSTGRRPGGRPKTHWRDYVTLLAWKYFRSWPWRGRFLHLCLEKPKTQTFICMNILMDR